jgi:hypothetical protein
MRGRRGNLGGFAGTAILLLTTGFLSQLLSSGQLFITKPLSKYQKC